MKTHVVVKAGLWLGVCLWAQASCNGGGSDSDGGTSGSGAAASAGAGAGAAGSSTAGFPGTGGFPGTAGSSAGQGAAGAAGGVQGAAGGAAPECGTTQCTNCMDDDGDGVVDGFDPDCTGPLDDDEGSYATGIPGDNVDACKQDCFFDGNSGSGKEKCLWELACDPANPGQNDGCPYDPDKNNCPPAPTQECIDACFGLVPNGCDCFGCCTVTLPQGGTRNVLLKNECSYDKINDTTVCPTCTPRATCFNDCGRCEYCIGKDEIPADCAPGGGGGSSGSSGAGGSSGEPQPTCSSGAPSCSPTKPCAGSSYCLTGCCIPIPR